MTDIVSIAVFTRDFKAQLPRIPIVPMDCRMFLGKDRHPQQTTRRCAHERQHDIPQRPGHAKLGIHRFAIVRRVAIRCPRPRAKEHRQNSPVPRIGKIIDFIEAELFCLELPPFTVNLFLALGDFNGKPLLGQRCPRIDDVHEFALRCRRESQAIFVGPHLRQPTAAVASSNPASVAVS